MTKYSLYILVIYLCSCAPNTQPILDSSQLGSHPTSSSVKNSCEFVKIKGSKGLLGANCQERGTVENLQGSCGNVNRLWLKDIEVSLTDFYIGRTEVTSIQYQKCVDAEVCSEVDRRGCLYDTYKHEGNIANSSNKIPQVCVTWHQARQYCKWIGGDLPTEIEWEFAARCRDGRCYKWPWGDDAPTLNRDHFSEREPQDALGPSGVFDYPEGATPSGVFGFAGNVSEWVLDGGWHYALEYECPHECKEINMDGINNTDKYSSSIVKGNSWIVTVHDAAPIFARRSYPKDKGRNDIGFRCVINSRSTLDSAISNNSINRICPDPDKITEKKKNN